MTGSRPRRDRDEERRARREHLLNASIEEIRRTGPGVTMEQLARAGGVTKPILYRHFGDRDGLIAAIGERFSVDLFESVMTPLQGSAGPRELLTTTVSSYVALLERDPSVYRFLVEQRRPTPPSDDEPSLMDRISRQVAVVIGEELARIGRDTGPAVAWAHAIVGLVHQSTWWWLQDQTMSRDRFVACITDLLWGGLDGPAGSVGTAVSS